MFYVSVSDLLKLDKFSHLKELDIIQLKYDEVVLKECFTIGLDIQSGYVYEYSTHRALSEKQPVLGFRLVGEIRKDKEFRKSPAYTVEAQMLSSLRSDVSLTKELCSLSGTSFNYDKLLEEDSENGMDSADGWEEGFEENSRTILMMNALAEGIRGNPYNSYGSFKCFREWTEDGV